MLKHPVTRGLARGLLMATILIILSVSAIYADGTSKRLEIINGCDDPIWIFYLVGDGGGTLNATNQYKLANKNDSISYDIPDIGLAGTRFWPGMGCDSTGNNCQIGQSGGPSSDGFSCPSPIGCAPAVDSKFEGTFGCLPTVPTSQCQQNPSSPGNPLPTTDGWDTSMVDGYTLPYKVTVTPPSGQTCSVAPDNNEIDCSGITFAQCPTDENLSTNGQFPSLSDVDLTLYEPNSKGKPTSTVAGCYSPCAKLSAGQWQSLPDPPFTGTTYDPDSPQAEYYCCPTPPISVDGCRNGPGATTDYVKLIHKQCPNVYAYAYDDLEGNFTCPAGTKYTVTFYCPE